MSLESSSGRVSESVENQRNQAVLDLASHLPIKQSLEAFVMPGFWNRVKRFGPKDGKVAFAVVYNAGKDTVQIGPIPTFGPTGPEPFILQNLPPTRKHYQPFTAKARTRDVLGVLLTHEGLAKIKQQRIVRNNSYYNSSINPLDWKNHGGEGHQLFGEPLLHTTMNSDNSFPVTTAEGLNQFNLALRDIYLRLKS